MSIDTWTRSRPGRCSDCGFHVETQGCACEGQRLKFRGQAIATAAHPTERAKVEAAIKQLAATGKPFSANDARALHGVSGGVVGATFTAMRTAGVIKRAEGDPLVPSTSETTHGHGIFRWIGAAA